MTGALPVGESRAESGGDEHHARGQHGPKQVRGLIVCLAFKSMSLGSFEDAVEDTLAVPKQFKQPQSTTGAIVARWFTTWMPARPNVYGPSGARSVRCVPARGQGMAIPHTLQVKYKAKAA